MHLHCQANFVVTSIDSPKRVLYSLNIQFPKQKQQKRLINWSLEMATENKNISHFNFGRLTVISSKRLNEKR